jgi:mono/diheme cytochrome c family protein
MKRAKLFAIIAFAVFAAIFYVIRPTPAGAVTPAPPEDAAATYKAKCLMCHGPTAAKFFNADMPKEEKVAAVLKGKKTEKPPAMPGFEAKGMTADDATALVDYMDGLKKPAQ